MVKTPREFNEKYKDHLVESHYGMSIYDEETIQYLDKEFEKIIKNKPEFKYYQIKMKWNYCTIYTTLKNNPIIDVWQTKVNEILKNK